VARFLLRRLIMLIVSLLVASFVIYGSLYIAPGNPIATLSGGRALPPQSVRVLERRYHLNRPFLVAYWDWLTGVLHGDLGISIVQRENVSSLIGPRVATTAELVVYGR
jgi:peptide/nickel transport system permease protein